MSTATSKKKKTNGKSEEIVAVKTQQRNEVSEKCEEIEVVKTQQRNGKSEECEEKWGCQNTAKKQRVKKLS